MFTDREKELFEKTIEHWKSMYNWAYTAPAANDLVSYKRVVNAIGEGFDTGYCPLCKTYRDNFRTNGPICGECPLFKEVGQCGKSNDNLYPDTRDKNWSQWTTAAEKFIKQLQSILDKNTKVEIDWGKPVMDIETGNTVTFEECRRIFQDNTYPYFVTIDGIGSHTRKQRVKNVPEVEYKPVKKGDRIMIEGREYLLCTTDGMHISLINTSTGNHWGDSVRVASTTTISFDEFTNLVGVNWKEVYRTLKRR
jgi:hypothetical protein